MSNKNNPYEIQLDKTSQTIQHVNFIKSLEILTKHLKDILVISDLSGNILFVSDSIERILGYEKEQYLGTGWKLTVSEEIEQYTVSKVQQHLKNNHFTIKCQHANGKQMLLRCIVDFCSFEEGEDPCYILTLSDITRNKEVEDLMVHAEKMSVAGQLAAGIAHEVRNPLTALKGFLQLLQSGIGDQEAYYRVMIDEIDKIDKITSEFLYLSKPITDSFDHYLLHDIVSDIVTLFQPQANEKEIIIINQVDKIIGLYCDQTQMKQMFINLIKNALEEMDVAGQIIIKSSLLDRFIQIDVIDEGGGIDLEVINKIREPFFTTKREGTGLGLAITKQIIDRHGGYLEIFRNESIGTTFRILLPRIT